MDSCISRKLKYLIPAVVLALLAIVLVAKSHAVAGGNKKVLLISVDGFRPDFYMDAKYQAPTMQDLKKNGIYASLGQEVVFPSLTYPNHTTLITGVYTDKHGVLNNSVFTWEQGPTPAWYWEADYIKVPTLHDRVQKAGLKSASARWPVTLKNETITYNIPEIFGMPGYYEGDSFDLTVKFTDPGLMQDVLKVTTLKKYKNEVETDFWVAEASAHILKTRKPDLMTIHLANVDHVEHGFGRDGKEVQDAVLDADNDIKIILGGIDPAEYCVIISGDHGFFNVSKKISPNVLFAQKGWLNVAADGKIGDWKVIAQSGGGEAAIYLKDKSLLPQVTKLLKDNESAGYRVIDRAKLDETHSYPEAVLAIEGLDGYTVSGAANGSLVGPSGSLKDNHGFLPEHPELRTGFIARGCGETAGTQLQMTRSVDIAPTIAQVMGLSVTGFDGKPIKLK